MPSLTAEQKTFIHARLRNRINIREIAAEVGVSKNTVLLAKKNQEYGDIGRKPSSSGRKISTAVQDEALINYLRDNPFHTAIKAKEEINFSGSTNTARNRIKNSDIRNRCAANKGFLTYIHKRRRMAYVEDI
ncbi:hypothetical protein ABEB36_003646 [Hypothenemus hampei]|uniref:Transposase n=1 Tax=Hypothenemus hampei TaxID=57062 RepID=A0ABD1FDH5_HYPHA